MDQNLVLFRLARRSHDAPWWNEHLNEQSVSDRRPRTRTCTRTRRRRIPRRTHTRRRSTRTRARRRIRTRTRSRWLGPRQSVDSITARINQFVLHEMCVL